MVPYWGMQTPHMSIKINHLTPSEQGKKSRSFNVENLCLKVKKY